jgi:hypothetical protein
MSVYKSIIQGLNEAADYQQGKIRARKTKWTIKLVDTINTKAHPKAVDTKFTLI